MANPNAIKPFWLESTSDQVEFAPGLVMEFLPVVQRYTRKFQNRFPYEDVEHRIMMGLYKAAYTWISDSGVGFIIWLNIKIRGEMSLLYKRDAYMDKHKIKVFRCYEDTDTVDSGFDGD